MKFPKFAFYIICPHFAYGPSVVSFMEIFRWPNKVIKVGRISNEYPFRCEHMYVLYFYFFSSKKICHTINETNERHTNTPENCVPEIRNTYGERQKTEGEEKE